MAIDDNANYTLTGAQVKDLANQVNGKADSSGLATVATSGSYNDLSNKPTIPTVNDATLTIQHNGTNVQTFTANQSTNATANIETIWADDIAPATTVPSVETAMIADGAVTNDKIDWSTVPSTYTECTTTGAQKTPSSGNCKICKIGKIVNLQVNYNYSGTKVFDLTDLGDVKIADIPAGYRPPFNIYGAAMVKCSSSTVGTNQVNQIHLWINSTGGLLINNMGNGALTGINTIRGNLTWFVA